MMMATLSITRDNGGRFSGYMYSFLEAATRNLDKVENRWPGESPLYPECLDDGFPDYERFPDVLVFDFIERDSGELPHVYIQVQGVNLGDRLTDNMAKMDGYRYHDIFHIAYAVHLGWSPVLRALLKLKRKSNPRIDENEDGARAQIIEEGIATWIFNHAAAPAQKYYENVKPGRLPYRLLKQVHSMVRGYEVHEAAMWQWERAILDGFRVFRALHDNKGGSVVADFRGHTLSYEPPAS